CTTALIVLAAKPLLDRLARKLSVRRGEVVNGIAILGIVPLSMLGVSYAFSDPIIASHFRCGTGEAMLFFIAPFVLLGTATASSVFALVFSMERRYVDS